MRIGNIVVVVVVLSLFLVSPVGAVTNGSPDGDGHPYVGLIVFYSGYDANNHPIPMWRCSGSLLSDTVFLTAAHCVTGPAPAFAQVWFAPVPTGQTSGQPADYTKYPYGGYNARGTHMFIMPGYPVSKNGVPEFRSQFPGFDYYDVAVVILDQWVTDKPSGRAQLPSSNYVDTLPMNYQVSIVNFGVQDKLQAPAPPVGSWVDKTRMYAPSQLVQSNDVISAEFLKLTANPGQGKGGTCFGDSGGPILDGNTVLGVNSFVTNSDCTGVTYSNRIDTTNGLNFIHSILAQY